MSECIANEHNPIAVGSENDLAALVALASLPKLSPSRFWDLLKLDEPARVWALVAAGRAPRHGKKAPDAARKWAQWCHKVDPNRELARHRDHGVAVLTFGHDQYPEALVDDPDPPPVLFRKGPQPLDDRTRVAIVGTRSCSAYGAGIARELGGLLAERDVDVVSGLASGIDAAAHAGAIAAAPERTVAVVANGIDVIYPPRNRGLYHHIGQQAVLLSEWPLGCRPETWRFPARNRVVAALSVATIVVESPVSGGSMYTVDEALRRDRDVFAVPGPIHSRTSKGTNKLIAEGAHPLHDVDELLEIVAPQAEPRPVQPELGVDSWLLEIVGWEPTAIDSLVSASGRQPSEVTLEIERLIGTQAIRRLGGVIERVL